jgi:hypothetical protein
MTPSLVLLVALSVVGVTAVSPVRADGQSLAGDSSRYSCGTGRIRNVELVTTPTTVRAAWLRPAASVEPVTSVLLHAEPTPDYFVVTVQFTGLFYVIRASADASWNSKPMAFRFDESIGVCVNAAEMVLDRLDGTDFRGRVIRVGRDEAPFVPFGR